MNRQTGLAAKLAALWLVSIMTSALAAEIPATLPKPAGEAPDVTKPVTVYIRMESNRLGFGTIAPETQKGTPGHVAKDPRYNIRYPDDYEKNFVNQINGNDEP